MSVYAEILQHRELFANLFRRDFRAKYKGTFLGVLWSLVNPLVLMGIYTLVFSVLFPVSQVPPLSPLSPLRPGDLGVPVGGPAHVGPLAARQREPDQEGALSPPATAFSTVAAQLVALAAILAVLIPVNLIVIPETRETIWLTIPLIVPVIALVAGLSLAVSAANVVFRDVEHMVAALLLPWFFLTPIMYSFEAGGLLRGPIEDHPTLVSFLHWGNPITPPIEAVRDVLFWGRLPHSGTSSICSSPPSSRSGSARGSSGAWTTGSRSSSDPQSVSTGAPSFSSTMITQSSASPTFSRECGGIGSDHIAVEGFGGPLPARVSRVTLPSPSRRTKSAPLTTYWTFGQRCVWTAVVSPAGMSVSRTRTCSFSRSR